jgi:hypothetical protein
MELHEEQQQAKLAEPITARRPKLKVLERKSGERMLSDYEIEYIVQYYKYDDGRVQLRRGDATDEDYRQHHQLYIQARQKMLQGLLERYGATEQTRAAAERRFVKWSLPPPLQQQLVEWWEQCFAEVQSEAELDAQLSGLFHKD